MKNLPLHEQLAHARAVAKLRQGDLAAIIGWKDHTQVSKVENNRGGTQTAEVLAWAEACGFEIVLVPKSFYDDEAVQSDPMLLDALVASVTDTFARGVIADLCRLTRRDKRFWQHLKRDIEVDEERARADEERAAAAALRA